MEDEEQSNQSIVKQVPEIDYQSICQQKQQNANALKQKIKQCTDNLAISYQEQKKIQAQKQKILQIKEKVMLQKHKSQNSKLITFDSFKKPHLQLRIHQQQLFDISKDKYLDKGTDYVDMTKRDSLLFPDKLQKKEAFFVKTMTNQRFFGDIPVEKLDKKFQPIKLQRYNTANELERLETESRVRKTDGLWKYQKFKSTKNLLFLPIKPSLNLLDDEVRSIFFESVRKRKNQ